MLKDLEVKLEALKTEEAGAVTKANFNILVKTEASEETTKRIFKLTVENCPVGKLFENAGVKVSYNMNIEK